MAHVLLARVSGDVGGVEQEARKLLGQYRASLRPRHNSPRLAAIAAMPIADVDARRWWDDHLVARYGSAVMVFRNPRVGIRPLRYVKLDVPDDPKQHVVIFMPDGEQYRHQLELLAGGGTAQDKGRPAVPVLRPRSFAKSVGVIYVFVTKSELDYSSKVSKELRNFRKTFRSSSHSRKSQ